jgi:hypothetical protein
MTGPGQGRRWGGDLDTIPDQHIGTMRALFRPGGQQLVKIERQAFEKWARSVFPDTEAFSLSKVATSAGVSKSTFFLQASRGQVDASLVIAYSRAVGIEPLHELLKFPQLDIFEDPRAPSAPEVLSQLPAEAHMEELLGRSRGAGITVDAGPMPPAHALKRWLDTYELWGRYEEMAQAVGLASAKSLTRKIADNNVSIGELVDMIKFADLVPRFGLVVTGHLTLEEAGYAADLRETVLSGSPLPVVVEALRPALRWFEKEAEANAVVRDFYQNLG